MSHVTRRSAEIRFTDKTSEEKIIEINRLIRKIEVDLEEAEREVRLYKTDIEIYDQLIKEYQDKTYK